MKVRCECWIGRKKAVIIWATCGCISHRLTVWYFLITAKVAVVPGIMKCCAIHPLALGRKNYLFAGSHDGARRMTIIYSPVATAKKHDVEPFAYLKDVITRITDLPYNKLSSLLPPNWYPAT